MSTLKDLTGQVFSRLTVVSLHSKTDSKHRRYWLCKCECGQTTIVRTSGLNYGSSKSCGCLQKDSVITHGNTNKRLFRIWKQMIKRCTNPKHNRYHLYGAKGVSVCAKWKSSFDAFEDWATSNGYQDNLSIDRINSKGNYEPSNCRWSTIGEQNRNYSRNIKYKGECAIDASKRLGGNSNLVRKRVAMG
jgi:hypothetical protein